MNQEESPHGIRPRMAAEEFQGGGQAPESLPFSPAAGCLIALVVVVIGTFLAIQIVRLVYFGEVRVGGPAISPNRIWLIDTPENAGLFYSSSRVFSGSLESNEVCLNTRVRSFQWRADESEPIEGYCLCYRQVGGSWEQIGLCPDTEVQ